MQVAAYPFTTLRPQLGALCADGPAGSVVVVADIPGLIAGAAANRGLGHAFLRHVERTRLLAYVVDLSGGLHGDEGPRAWDQLTMLQVHSILLQASGKLSVSVPEPVACVGVTAGWLLDDLLRHACWLDIRAARLYDLIEQFSFHSYLIIKPCLGGRRSLGSFRRCCSHARRWWLPTRWTSGRTGAGWRPRWARCADERTCPCSQSQRRSGGAQRPCAPACLAVSTPQWCHRRLP